MFNKKASKKYDLISSNIANLDRKKKYNFFCNLLRDLGRRGRLMQVLDSIYRQKEKKRNAIEDGDG